MYYVYVLLSSSKKLCIGSSAKPDERLKAHNAGRGGWTKRYRPWKRILLEEYASKMKAAKRERYLKSGWGRRWLKKNISTEEWQSGRSRRS
ncbi:MAG: GIY-YIG nuclease family protein [bacterium]|nr:GIY-YIG nuclease family protein [bacterium]